MTERDPLKEMLQEWKPAEPSSEMDERVVKAYRSAVPKAEGWGRFWKARISVPVPVLVAAMAVIAVFLWYRSGQSASAPPDAAGTATQLTGFQPLPNGEARVIPVREAR